MPYLATAVWLVKDDDLLSKTNQVPIPFPKKDIAPEKIKNYQVG